MSHATILIVILAFVPLARATAQVQPGARVRLSVHYCQPSYSCVGADTVGTFLAWKADTLVMESNGDTLTVPVTLLTRLDVSRGRKTNTGAGAGIGFLVGAVMGAVIGYASYEECVGGWGCFVDFGPGTYAAVGGLVFGAAGALLGAVGGAATKTDRWVAVPLERLRLQVAPQRDGRFGFGASVRF